MNVVSFQYSYGFLVGDRIPSTLTSRFGIDFCDNVAIFRTSSNEQADGKHIPRVIVRGCKCTIKLHHIFRYTA